MHPTTTYCDAINIALIKLASEITCKKPNIIPDIIINAILFLTKYLKVPLKILSSTTGAKNTANINTFNNGKNIKLATYASRCIENEILMYLRRSSKTKGEVSIDEPLNQDGDGNELLLSDILRNR